jgi:hypothetical protein
MSALANSGVRRVKIELLSGPIIGTPDACRQRVRVEARRREDLELERRTRRCLLWFSGI